MPKGRVSEITNVNLVGFSFDTNEILPLPYESLPTCAGSADPAVLLASTSRIGDPLSLFSSVSALLFLPSSTSEELFLLLRLVGSYLCRERRLFPLSFLPLRTSSFEESLRRLTGGEALRLMLRDRRLTSRLPRLSFLTGLEGETVLFRGVGLRLNEGDEERDLDLELVLRRRYLRDFGGGERLKDSVEALLRFRGGERDFEVEGDLRRGLLSGLLARPLPPLPRLRLSGDLDLRLRGDGDLDSEADLLRRLGGDRDGDFDLEGDLERDKDGLRLSSRLSRVAGT